MEKQAQAVPDRMNQGHTRRDDAFFPVQPDEPWRPFDPSGNW